MTDCHRARDAYFTRKSVARRVWATALRECRRRDVKPTDAHWVEPSAGAGVFIKTKPACVKRFSCVDIHPLHPDVRDGDFLQTTRQSLGIAKDELVIVIGNPPFGFQGSMVRKFIHIALVVFDVEFACYIVPPICVKAIFHNRLLQPIGMSLASPLPVDSFETPDGKAFSINTPPYVAVYARNAPRIPRPPNQHPDFYTNGLHTESKDDPRLKNPVPHRLHALKKIRRGGFAFAYKSSTGDIVTPDEMPREWDDFDGFGAIYLVYANRHRITDAELLRRWRTIDWKAITASNRKATGYVGCIAPRHAVAAYNEKYGGLDDEPQPSLF